jgi:hypothetical protein
MAIDIRTLKQFEYDYDLKIFRVKITESNINFIFGEGDKKVTVPIPCFRNVMEIIGDTHGATCPIQIIRINTVSRYGTRISIIWTPPSDAVQVFTMIGAAFGVFQLSFEDGNAFLKQKL